MSERATQYQRTNREFWDADADDYQNAHHADISNPAWGAYRIPESEVEALPSLAGLDVLELGCGGAQASIAFTGSAASSIGLDLSVAQLRHAQRNARAAARRIPVVCASAVATPFRSSSFDLAFCDHGAMSFCDPHATVPEAARLLRPGGWLVFCLSTHLHNSCFPTDDPDAAITTTLQQPMYRAGGYDWGDGTIDFQILHAEWIQLFRANSFTVEGLIALRPPESAATGYDGFATAEWSRNWPAEEIWQVRKL